MTYADMQRELQIETVTEPLSFYIIPVSKTREFLFLLVLFSL